MEDLMADLEKGITQNGSGYAGKSWNHPGAGLFSKGRLRIDLRLRDEQPTVQ
jgi:hypothetical protein